MYIHTYTHTEDYISKEIPVYTGSKDIYLIPPLMFPTIST